ncbi:small secreted protein [Streptomyces orinoci]|uniref:Small secreted protein n=1 Tax=Streptomyces orinoci TaxID=67339 RepID=A0ABV3K1B2_STRON|nr:small secreted protein [Streptomyces orinoci]
MNKKLLTALSGGAALVLALTGCGGGDDSGKKLDKWAKQVCDQMQPQVKKIQDANSSIASMKSEEDSKKVQQTDSAAFQANADAYKELASAVNNAGAPPVKDGATSQKNAVKALNDLSAAYTGLKKKVEGLNTNDKAKFASGLDSIGSDIRQLTGKSQDALNNLQSGDVGKAMVKQPACKNSSASGTPTTK